MALSEARKKANEKWNAKAYDEIKVRVSKGSKADIQAHAEFKGESLNSFINRSIKGTIERDVNKMACPINTDKPNLLNLYNDWIYSHTTEEGQLCNLVWEYEQQYFEDMTLSPGSVVDEFIKYQVLGKDGGYYYDDFNLKLDENYFRCYVEKLDDGTAGRTYTNEHKIVIDLQYANDKNVILHEMIHAYEVVISEKFPYLHDILLLCLYNDLKEKICDLDDRILNHTHTVRQENVYLKGGLHDALFFLKSLDLDLRCGLKLGMVCGYGRDEY